MTTLLGPDLVVTTTRSTCKRERESNFNLWTAFVTPLRPRRVSDVPIPGYTGLALVDFCSKSVLATTTKCML